MVRLVVLAAALGIAAGVAAWAAAADLSRPEIRQATAALAAAGYRPGPVDGDWGAADAAALRAYQADWRLPETGEPSAEMLARLTREHAATRPHWVETDGSGTGAGCRVWDRYPQAQERVSWTGACVDGATSGQGVLTWTSVRLGRAEVETYAGERRDGREEGHGVYVGADGSRYEGDWRAGVKNGQGRYTSPEGNVYVGEYCRRAAPGAR